MAKPLRYSDYDPRWKDEFNRLRDYLDHLLNPYIIDILHVGSTSVEGLGAKPILDVNIIFEEHFEIIKRILEEQGYLYEGEKGISDRHAFKQTADTFYEHHLYVSKTGTTNLLNQVAFKRALQSNPSYRREYMTLKQNLIATDKNNRVLYTDSKTPFITRVLKEVQNMNTIVFAGGCFWGVEAYFKLIDGVIDTEVGYTGAEGYATYEEVCRGSGHTEAVLIQYDGTKVSLNILLDHLFNIIDPTSKNKQGNDRGIQYRTGIYNYLPEELPVIESYLAMQQQNYNKPLQLELETGLTFYAAEDYHQDYLDKRPFGYCHVDLSSHGNVK